MKTLTTLLAVIVLTAISIPANAGQRQDHATKCIRAGNGCSTSSNASTRELRITNSPTKHRKHNYRGIVTLVR